MDDFVEIRRGEAPLIVSLPHTGTDIPDAMIDRFVSPERARYDADWFIDQLYDFAPGLDATVIRTPFSRSVIDVNRDPSGKSLYPGQAITGLCPTSTFAGLPLYREGEAPDAAEIAERRRRWFDPYHAAIEAEIARLHRRHPKIVLYDCHSIRSVIPRLFEGELPHVNIGTNKGASCDPELTRRVEAIFRASPFSTVVDGRFTGGWITRRHGRPDRQVHAIQVELSLRGYMPDDAEPVPGDRLDRTLAVPMRAALEEVLAGCLAFAEGKPA